MFTTSYINEIWKPIRGYEGLYEVSNFGRVKSLNYKGTGKEKTLKPLKDSKGYLMVRLYKELTYKNFKVHRLVWEAFNGSIPEGMQCNHINERKDDNRLENLNLMTCKENSNWGTRNERISVIMVNHPSRSKPVLQYTKDGKFVAEYPSGKEVMRQTGIYQANISACCLGKKKSAGGFKWVFKQKDKAS